MCAQRLVGRIPSGWTLTVLLTAAVLGSACSRELGRGKAAELIISENRFPSPVTAELPSNCKQDLGPGMWDSADEDQFRRGGMSKAEIALRGSYDPLQIQGLLNYGLKRVKSIWSASGLWVVTVSLTPAGEAYRVGVRADERDSNCSYAVVKACERDFVAVTGIVGDEKRASVQYQWHYTRPTPFAPLTKECSSADLKSADTGFLRYDDGWR